MEAKYQTLLEQIAEWFMQFFFDPSYHVIISSNGKNDDGETELETNSVQVKIRKTVKAVIRPFKSIFKGIIRVQKSILGVFNGFQLAGVIPLLTYRCIWGNFYQFS